MKICKQCGAEVADNASFAQSVVQRWKQLEMPAVPEIQKIWEMPVRT